MLFLLTLGLKVSDIIVLIKIFPISQFSSQPKEKKARVIFGSHKIGFQIILLQLLHTFGDVHYFFFKTMNIKSFDDLKC